MKITVELLREGTRVDSYAGEVKISRACCSAVVLIRAQGDNIIVDPGAMDYADEVLCALHDRGLRTEDINIIVNTHMHLDHTYNDYLFKDAIIYTPTSVWYTDDGNRVEMFSDVVDLKIPGITVIDTAGHMEKHISLIVESEGKRIVIAGDAVRESIIQGERVPEKYPNAKEYLKSMKKIFAVADEIIPGHGPIIKGERLKQLKEIVKKLKV